MGRTEWRTQSVRKGESLRARSNTSATTRVPARDVSRAQRRPPKTLPQSRLVCRIGSQLSGGVSMQVVEIPILRCFRCAYVWRPSRPVVRICPRCKSERWDRPKVSRALGPRTGLGVAEVVGRRRLEVLRIARRFGARDVRVFGSVRRGQAAAASDLDLLVRFRRGVDLFDQMHLEHALEELLGRKVDVVTEAGLHPLVRPQALFEAVPL